MPIYEYNCRDCGTHFEEIVSVNEQKNPLCPSCHSDKTEKKISVFCSINNAGRGKKSGGGSVST